MKQNRNWNDLAEVVDVMTLDSRDEECLRAIQGVVESFELTGKFGVALLHKHFDIGDDEVLLETHDAAAKTLTTRAVSSSEVDLPSIATTVWRFDGGARYGCSYCNRDHHS